MDFFPEKLLTGEEVKKAYRQGKKKLFLLPGTIVTPLARDVAEDLKVELLFPLLEEEELTSGPVALGADHGGYALKEVIKKSLKEWGYEVIDVGTHSEQSVDYPDYAYQVAKLVSEKKAWRGIMVDGVGIGSAMVANKVAGVRAANCHNLFEIQNSRRHNNANVLCLGGQTLGPKLALSMVKLWLDEPFEEGRHARRVSKINRLDWGEPPR